jgi:RNA polymerase sigma-70 factor (ECF subfamily)
MQAGTDETLALLERAAGGDSSAMSALFERYRIRLKKMVRVRLNRRLQGRVDDSDVLQDAYVEATRRLQEYLSGPRAPFFLWLRQITSQKLLDAHRRHLGAQARDARLELTLHWGRLPVASSVFLAAQLLGRLTSPSEAAVKAETRLALQEALGRMEDNDREILALRVYEDMSNQEAAEELGIDEKAASKRYVRALQRLQKILAEHCLPG